MPPTQRLELRLYKYWLLFLQNGPFAWDKAVQAHILGAFFYGYLMSQIPSGYFAER